MKRLAYVSILLVVTVMTVAGCRGRGFWCRQEVCEPTMPCPPMYEPACGCGEESIPDTMLPSTTYPPMESIPSTPMPSA